jgi:hypothetical protein
LICRKNRAFMRDNSSDKPRQGVDNEDISRKSRRRPGSGSDPQFRPAAVGHAQIHEPGTTSGKMAGSLRSRSAQVQETVSHQTFGLPHPGTFLRWALRAGQGPSAAARFERSRGDRQPAHPRRAQEQRRDFARHPAGAGMEGPTTGTPTTFAKKTPSAP